MSKSGAYRSESKTGIAKAVPLSPHKAPGRSQSGAQIAEAAVVLPILFLVIMAVFWFALAFNVSSTVERAAKQGIQAAARPTCATCGNSFSTAAAVTAVQSALLADHLDPANIANIVTNPPPPFACTGGSTGCSISSNIQICTTAPLNCGNATCQNPPVACGTAGVTRGTRVSFGYRYNSPVPLGTWSSITIPATAQSPREN